MKFLHSKGQVPRTQLFRVFISILLHTFFFYKLYFLRLVQKRRPRLCPKCKPTTDNRQPTTDKQPQPHAWIHEEQPRCQPQEAPWRQRSSSRSQRWRSLYSGSHPAESATPPKHRKAPRDFHVGPNVFPPSGARTRSKLTFPPQRAFAGSASGSGSGGGRRAGRMLATVHNTT